MNHTIVKKNSNRNYHSNNLNHSGLGMLVVIDRNVDDIATLVNGVLAGAKVLVLDSATDSIEQITRALAEETFNSLHLVSHGASGVLYLGNNPLTLDNLNRYSYQLQEWGVPEILLYGCHVAAGDAGLEFIEGLHRLTGANIAASGTKTGNSALGGDWNLEVHSDRQLVNLAFSESAMAQYSFTLMATQIGADIDGEAAEDYSGDSVSLSADGTVVAIGASWNDGNGDFSGHVRLYENIGGSWTQIGADIDGEAAEDYSGVSVSLSADGTVVAIGGSGNDGNGTDSGHVRLYENINGTWTQIGADIDGEAAGDRSGLSVSLSADGTVVAIGAHSNDGNGTDSGHVRLYENINDTWTQIGADIDGEAAGDRSGRSVSLSADGTVVAIGATWNDGNGTDSGHVRLYENIDGTWTQIGADIDGEAAGDESGNSVSLSADGTEVAIGAWFNEDNGLHSGHVRLYENVNGTWTQIGADIDGEVEFDYTGQSVSLSADGTVVAIGASFDDGSVIVDDGSNIGHVRLYENANGTWTQIGADIDGEATFDNFGYSVSLSADGTVVAIGAPENDGNGTDSGHVRLFSTDIDGVDDCNPTPGDDNLTSCATPEADNINALAGNDTLAGGDGNDTLKGAIGADIINGDNDNDSLLGGGGNDTLNGGVGTDFLHGQNDNDSLAGGDGNDTLNGGAGADILNGGNDNDSLLGAAGNNTLDGGAGADTLRGGNDNDSLLGAADNDKLFGGTGLDTLTGGLGIDILDAGASDGVEDRFQIESTTAANRDVIKNFEVGTDKFELVNLTFGALTFTQAGSDTKIWDTTQTPQQLIAVVKGIDEMNINDQSNFI